MKKLIRFSIFCLTVAMVSCSKDDDSTAKTAAFTPKFSTVAIDNFVPASMEQKAPEAFNQLSMINGFMAMPGAFMTPPNTNKSGNASAPKTWTSGGYTIAYSYSSDETKYSFNYTATQNGTSFFTISGWENKDGSAGAWNYQINANVMGGPSGSNFNVNFTWNKNNTGGYNFDMVFDFGDYSMHYVVNQFTSKTGEYFLYEDDKITMECHWTAVGGTFTNYSGGSADVTTWSN